MFHRLNAGKSDVEADSPQQVKKDKPNYMERQQRSGLDQSAVERFAKSSETLEADKDLPPANQNATSPYAIKTVVADRETTNYQAETKLETKPINKTELIIKEEDTKPMNTDNTQNKSESQTDDNSSMQERVDIPGNNFQRPNRSIGQPAAATAQPASRPAYPGTYASSPYGSQANDGDNRKLVIGQGINLSGEIDSCDHLIVEGTVEAALKGANMMDVSESGAFFGTVEIEEAVIAGRFEGDIVVNGRLTIRSTGVVMGTISYKEIAIEAGATLEGTIAPIGSTVTAAKPTTKKAATPAKSKKVQNTDNELPFADKTAAAAE